MKTIHRCKSHNYEHSYTVCPLCECQYCERTWPVCPRISWHPNHADNDAERGRRQRELYTAHKESERVLVGRPRLR